MSPAAGTAGFRNFRMFVFYEKTGIKNLLCLLLFACSVCRAAEPCSPAAGIDKTRYITIDEIQPGMDAYCLTCYKGTEIEKFGLKVLSVVRNMDAGRSAILVQGTDERFIHSGPVAGCSGSPVYINGRLAGALAFGWVYSKDPLYGVTPIEEILKVGRTSGEQKKEPTGFAFDFSRPINFTEIGRQMADGKRQMSTGRNSDAVAMPCPLIVSGVPAGVCEEISRSVEPFGLMAVSGPGADAGAAPAGNVPLVPGACLAIPVVSGDIRMTVIGTVTEVIGDKIYGFGHGFLGYGDVNLPMAGGQVHTVVSSLFRSFKFAAAGRSVGALTTDESASVCGRLGAEAKTIPLTIEVNRYNDAEKRVYKCLLADNRVLTPDLLGMAVTAAAFRIGELPPDNTIEYKVAIGLNDAELIVFENVSTGTGLAEMLKESTGSVAMLMNNPYKKVAIKSITVDIRQVQKNIVSHIWSVDLSDSEVKAGQQVGVEVVVESFLAGKEKYGCTIRIPDELAPGKYELIVCGGYDYLAFLRDAASYKFIPQNLTSLVDAMNNVLNVARDRLYCILVLPPRGLSVELAELPDLPATKAMVMQDGKRTLEIRPYSRWLEKSFRTGTVVMDKKVVQITVEKQ